MLIASIRNEQFAFYILTIPFFLSTVNRFVLFLTFSKYTRNCFIILRFKAYIRYFKVYAV